MLAKVRLVARTASFAQLTRTCLADGPALVILALVCANVRNCVRPASVLRALEILLALNRYLTDETRLDRLVPYLVTLLSDDAATVRAMALRVLTQTVRLFCAISSLRLANMPLLQLMLVTTLTPSNVDVFPEYIFPNVRPLANDVDILPRETYALCITPLARTARRFLDLAEALKTEGAFELSGLQDFESSPYTVSRLGSPAEAAELTSRVAGQLRLAPARTPRSGARAHWPASH